MSQEAEENESEEMTTSRREGFGARGAHATGGGAAPAMIERSALPDPAFKERCQQTVDERSGALCGNDP